MVSLKLSCPRRSLWLPGCGQAAVARQPRLADSWQAAAGFKPLATIACGGSCAAAWLGLGVRLQAAALENMLQPGRCPRPRLRLAVVGAVLAVAEFLCWSPKNRKLLHKRNQVCDIQCMADHWWPSLVGRLPVRGRLPAAGGQGPAAFCMTVGSRRGATSRRRPAAEAVAGGPR